jgi:hypothetical protein
MPCSQKSAAWRELFLNTLLQLIVTVELLTGKKSLQVQEQMKVYKEGDPPVHIWMKQGAGIFEPRHMCTRRAKTTPALSMPCRLFCITRCNLFRVSQYTAALIVVPRVRNSTNKILCLSQNTVHVFLVDIVWRPTSKNRAYKNLCHVTTSASEWVVIMLKSRLRYVEFDNNKNFVRQVFLFYGKNGTYFRNVLCNIN